MIFGDKLTKDKKAEYLMITMQFFTPVVADDSITGFIAEHHAHNSAANKNTAKSSQHFRRGR